MQESKHFLPFTITKLLLMLEKCVENSKKIWSLQKLYLIVYKSLQEKYISSYTKLPHKRCFSPFSEQNRIPVPCFLE